MRGLSVSLLRHTEKKKLETFLRVYQRCFTPDERVSPRILRRVIRPSPARVNHVHLYAAHLNGKLVGGACMVVFPAFQVVFGSYLFVDPACRGKNLGGDILRKVLRLVRRGPYSPNWRVYGEVTARAGTHWRGTLARLGFRFFRWPWPLVSYQDPGRVIWGRLCYYSYRRKPPPRFSQPALLSYVHALFYGPEAMHRYLLPRLKNFVELDA